MATRTFDVEATVPVAPDVAIDFLLHLDRHRGLHPYFLRAVVLARGSDADGPWAEWKVDERPRLGPFSYPLTFRARLTQTSATSMKSLVRPAPGCRLHIVSTAAEAAGGSHVAETVVVTAPWPLVGYMERQARIAHTRLFRLLPAELAN